MSAAPVSTAPAANTAAAASAGLGPAEAYDRALDHLRSVQQPKGALAGECVWNPMLVCQYVFVMRIVGREIPEDRKHRIRLSLERQLRPDGGWGMHPDSPSFLFHTVLGYVTLRLLGADRDDPLCNGARTWIHDHGGVYEIPTWGRIWLALLGMYPWSGVQPILPELWLLPDASPMHPRRLYCHMRLIYLGLSYVYGARFVAPIDDDLATIRRELYPEGYDEQRFERYRQRIAATDLFETPSPGLYAAFRALRGLEKLSPRRLRHRALARALEHIRFEFRSTGYVCLSPVNGFLFCLSLYIADADDKELDLALQGMDYWAWEDEVDGLRFCGARSDIWDTSFLLQALVEGPPTATAKTIARDACRWLPTAQLLEDIVGGEEHYRESAYGGWGFANEDHPWPVSDCTVEALEALIRCEETGLSDEGGRIQLTRKLAAMEFVLKRQNEDGGFGSYEPRRGSMVLKRFNPAEIYGNCMLEYSYTECTGSCIRGLAFAMRQLGDDIPADLRKRTQAAIDRGAEFVLGQQHANGGWLGFWGINFTYGTLFATSGLIAAGISRSHPAITRACRYLVGAQRSDGGWGESYVGNIEDADVPLPEGIPSTAVQTAWALLTLLESAPHEREAIDRGIGYLLSIQTEDGSWPPEAATGVFFNTAVLDYVLYRQIFPTWALARYQKVYDQPSGGGKVSQENVISSSAS